MGALRAALSGLAEPLALTSVKGNLAHMEAAAGLSGVIKLAAMLRHGATAPGVHARKLNPNIEEEGFPWHMVTELADPSRTDTFIGVQAMGMT